MKVNVYLPDDLGERAKAAGELNLSGLLQGALRDELDRREALASLLDGELPEHELDLEDRNGNHYVGVIHGKLLAEGRHDELVYLTDDERVLVYDAGNLRVDEL